MRSRPKRKITAENYDVSRRIQVKRIERGYILNREFSKLKLTEKEKTKTGFRIKCGMTLRIENG